jgi:ParB family chromosome partitioning protein
MITSVPFSALVAPKDNPRRVYDKKAIEGLAQSIKKDGVLQNLTVKPVNGSKYQVVAGKRRFLALQHLVKKGDIKPSYKVPIGFSKKASAGDLDRVATVENVQREPLDAIDEAEAFARLLGGGAKIEDVSVETGVSVQTIKRRVALADLIPEVKAAVREGKVPLSVAEVLTLATAEWQKFLLKDLKRNPSLDARYLRSQLLQNKPSAAIAIFPLEKYQGTYTRDLFAEKDATFFDDLEQFTELQRQAVEVLAQENRKAFAWVEVVTEHHVSWWQYRQAKKKEASGVVIHFAPTGRVEVRKGLVRQEVDPKATGGRGKATKPKERAPVSRPTYRYVNARRTLALQMALMANPRKAKEVAAMLLLSSGSYGANVKLMPHDALRELAKNGAGFTAYATMEKSARTLLDTLGVHASRSQEVAAWVRVQRPGQGWKALLAGVRSLNDVQLDFLIAFLLVLCFGVEQMESAEPNDSLFTALAHDLTPNMREFWVPDEPFLNGLRREELIKAAEECGALKKQPRLTAASKKDLVAALAAYFKRTADKNAQLDAVEEKGRTWLPACMALKPLGAAEKAERS